MTEPRRSRITSVGAGPVSSAGALVRLWGDDEAGWVNDWVYVSSERLYQIVLSMPPGASFRHSARNRTVFGADELYLVLDGTFALANPETGEVVHLRAGDAAWFGHNTWHHGFVVGPHEARVLEYFAPPPAAGMSQDYARTRPYLERRRYVVDHALGGWPPASDDPARTIHPIEPARTLWRLEGARGELLVGILLSTPNLTVGTGELPPGGATHDRRHGGDLGLYVLDGHLTVTAGPEGDATRGSRLGAADGFFVPQGTAYRLRNDGDRTTRFVFGVAPGYHPEEDRAGA